MVDRCDVVVVGLGGMGASIAAQLARRGRSVIGIDRFSPPHDHGSSHGRSRIIRKAYFEGAAYVPLLERSYAAWSALEGDAGTRLLTTTGGLFLGREDDEVVAGTLAAAREHDLEHQLLDGAEIRQRFPAFAADDDDVAVFEADAGVVFPLAGHRAYLRRAHGDGADLRTDTTVTDWDVTADGVEVALGDGGRVIAERLVLAPGPWAADLLRLDGAVEVERQCVFWFARGTDAEELLPPAFPVFVWANADGPPIYGAPGLRGEGPKVAFHHGGVTGRVDELDPDVQPEDEADLRDVLRSRIPALDVEPSDAMTCRYTNTPDGHFLLGHHPESERVVVAAGFSGHGFKFCPVVGEVVADLATDGSTALDLDTFDPGRFTVASTG